MEQRCSSRQQGKEVGGPPSSLFLVNVTYTINAGGPSLPSQGTSSLTSKERENNISGGASPLSPFPGSSSCIANTVDSHIANTVVATVANTVDPLLHLPPYMSPTSLKDASVWSANLLPLSNNGGAQGSPQQRHDF